MILSFLLFACTQKSATDASTFDPNQLVGPNEVAAKELNGTVPPTPVFPPDFTAVNADGTTRSKQDLMDHRTVLWFYPITGTPG